MSLEGARILMIDDHRELAEDLIEILRDQGARVSHARTGARALELAEEPFDVALLDVKLPDETGLSLLPKLREASHGMAEVLLITGHASLEDAMQAVKGGAYAYILKPFNPDDLLAEVERALRQVRSTREAEQLRHTLAEREARLRTLVNTVQALLLELDSEGVVLQANPAAAEAVGMNSEELLSRNWVDEFVPRQQRDEARAALRRVVLKSERITREYRLVVRTADGGMTERWVNWTLSRLEEGETPDRAVRVYISGIDTTELKTLERRTRLSEKLAAVGTMAAGLAHEIRNPLNAANLQLRLLERTLGSARSEARVTEPVRLVQDELKRLSRLVHEFLMFARPGDLQPGDVDLGGVAVQVADLEGPVARERNIELKLTLPEEPVVVVADREKVLQLLMNLVHNAVEALSDGGGEVRVLVERDGAGGRLVVRDDGPGIPVEHLNRIFEPFFSTKPGGTGLGMAIVHSLVEIHGGTIEVRPLEQGTEVDVVLPANPPDARAPRGPA